MLESDNPDFRDERARWQARAAEPHRLKEAT